MAKGKKTPANAAHFAAKLKPISVPSGGRACVGRAELLRLLVLWGSDTPAGGAQVTEQATEQATKQAAGQLTGFCYREPEPVPQAVPAPTPAPSAAPAPIAAAPTTPARPRAQHYSATLQPLPKQTLPDDFTQRLEAVANAKILSEPAPNAAPPPWQPLSSQRRLAVLAEKHLRSPYNSQQWNIAKLVQQLSHGLPPNLRRARQQRLRWQGNALVLFQQRQTEPLHQDYNALVQVVQRRSGGRVPIYAHYQDYGWFVYQAHGQAERQISWQKLPHIVQAPPLAGMGGLVVGLPNTAATGAPVWPQQWAPTARLAADPMALTSAQLKQLLALLTLAVVVHPPLLRALRCVLGLPACAELAAWASDDVACNNAAIAVLRVRREYYTAILQSDIPLALRQQAAALIAAHHRTRSFNIVLEELHLAELYAPGATWFEADQEIFRHKASAYFASMARELQTSVQSGHVSSPMAERMAYFTRQGQRMSAATWENAPELVWAWAWSNQEAVRTGVDIPKDMPAEVLQKLQIEMFGQHAVLPEQPLRLLQADGKLVLAYGEGGGAASVAASLLTLGQANRAKHNVLATWHSKGMVRWRSGLDGVWRPAQRAQDWVPQDLALHTPLEISDGHRLCRVQHEPRPAWALEWGRDAAGLYALMPNLWGEPVRVSFPLAAFVPMQVGVAQAKGSGNFRVQTLTLERDDIGPFATLTVVGKNGAHSQVFRYIAPGRFLMGSPDEETVGLDHQAWYEDEKPQHVVTISEGFWLADTACTQGFWQAVMGNNPSKFDVNHGGGPNHPVEQVSWDDIQAFMQKLQSVLATLANVLVTLPTEAEWEYACRAGTTTPFWFGETIGTEQVNYDGNYPWRDGKKGEYRQKTLDVKKLPANAWGLHQMHGNVWEWCADELRQYKNEAVFDPGLDVAMAPVLGTDAARVLRGGGWVSNAQFVRSAYRDRARPVGLNVSTGFRLALRFQSQASGV